MPTNEDGEFELILGNRQMMSVFFIVVILLGVFFTMGYIVGRNSSPVATAEVNPARKSEPKPLVGGIAHGLRARNPLPKNRVRLARPLRPRPSAPPSNSRKFPSPPRANP